MLPLLCGVCFLYVSVEVHAKVCLCSGQSFPKTTSDLILRSAFVIMLYHEQTKHPSILLPNCLRCLNEEH